MEEKKKGSGKGSKKIFLTIAGFILIFIAAFFYFSYYQTGPLATLVIDSGIVQFRSTEDWQTAKSGMTLQQGYLVKTLADSQAKIIFSDSVMRLDENTEISLDTLSQEGISLSQILGRTWTKLLKMSGITSYEISTPNAIATVRGTAFALSVTENETDIAVVEGNVSVDSYKLEEGVKKKIASKLLTENRRLVIRMHLDRLEDSELIEDIWIARNRELDKEHLALLKQRVLQKYRTFISIAKQRGLTEEQIHRLIEEWLAGNRSIRKAIEEGEISPAIAKIMPPELKRY